MKIKMMVLSAVLAVCASLGVANSAFAEITCPKGSVRSGKPAASYAECNLPEDLDKEDNLMTTAAKIINIVVGVVGVISVAVIVIGAIYFVVSLGDAAKINRAKNAVLYGVVGLVLAVLAFAIVNFVLSTVFGSGSTGGGSKDKDSGSSIEAGEYVKPSTVKSGEEAE